MSISFGGFEILIKNERQRPHEECKNNGKWCGTQEVLKCSKTKQIWIMNQHTGIF